MKTVDTLSRASLNDITPKIETLKLNVIYNYLVSDYRLQQFQHETKTDESLQTFLVFVQNGWPKNRDQIPETVRPYYTHIQELTYSNEIVFKYTRMLVPKTLRNE